MKLKGGRSGTIDKIQNESQSAFRAVTKRVCEKIFQRRKKRWHRRIAAQEDYFEGDDSLET